MVLVGRLIWQFYYRAGATGACAACGCPCAGTAGAPGTGALACAAPGACGCAGTGAFAAAAAAFFISPCKVWIDVPRAARVVCKALTSLGSTGIAFLFFKNIAFIVFMNPRNSVVVLLGAAATACSTIGFVSPIIWLMTLSIHSLSDNILFWFL
jgi:hypothetical protein